MNQKNNKFNEFLELYESYIDKCDTNSLKNIFSIHNKINKYINENDEIEINIINNYLEKHKDSNDKKIKKIITFIELKNKYMIIEAKKLDSWNKTINDISTRFNCDIDKVDKIFTKILLQSKNKFNGNWDVILTDKNGKPNKIELIDPNYINLIYENIK